MPKSKMRAVYMQQEEMIHWYYCHILSPYIAVYIQSLFLCSLALPFLHPYNILCLLLSLFIILIIVQVPYLSLEHLCTPPMQDIEAKFSVMQATYLIIQASNDAVTGHRLYQQFYGVG